MDLDLKSLLVPTLALQSSCHHSLSHPISWTSSPYHSYYSGFSSSWSFSNLDWSCLVLLLSPKKTSVYILCIYESLRSCYFFANVSEQVLINCKSRNNFNSITELFHPLLPHILLSMLGLPSMQYILHCSRDICKTNSCPCEVHVIFLEIAPKRCFK